MEWGQSNGVRVFHVKRRRERPFRTFHVKQGDGSFKKHGLRLGLLVRRPSRPLSQELPTGPSLPDTEFSKDHVKNLLDIDSSSESPETRQGMAQILCHELFASALLRPGDGLPQGGQDLT